MSQGGANPQAAAAGSSTPTRLRRLRAAAVLGCVLTGAAATGYLSTQGLEASPQAQASRLSHASTAVGDLEAMDAAAGEMISQSVLTHRAAGSTTFDAAARQASVSVAATARAGSDVPEAQEAAAALTSYVQQVERARALSTTAPQKATQVYTATHDRLQSEAIDQLSVLADESATQLNPLQSHGIPLAAVLGAVTTGGLLLASWWLARKTHRIVNPGLAAAAVLTAAITWLAVNPASLPSGTTSELERTFALVQVRTDAHAARSAEVRSVLPGGSAADWDTPATKVQQAVGGGLIGTDGVVEVPEAARTAWSDYQKAHEALSSATTSTAKATAVASAGKAYDTFDQALAGEIRDGGAVVVSDSASQALLGPGLGLLSGLLAAAAAWSGLTRRLKEYR